MRIEELQNNLYIKSTDTVEKYLLNIIQEYFKDSNEAVEGSKEYIIKEAVDRLKSEMDYNSLGVLSITLPNGDVRKGDVTVTLEDLNGEPLISPKLSAFNVPFGDLPNTACEGNDPRLYNARKPIQHEHEISDIRGLEGTLSTITNLISRSDTMKHVHTNKDVLDMLTYTGVPDGPIDLAIIDELEPKLTTLIDEIKANIADYVSRTNTRIDEINDELLALNTRVDNLYAYVLTKSHEIYTDAINEANTKIELAKTDLKTYITDNYVLKSEITDLINIAQQSYVLINTEQWNLKDLIIAKDPVDNSAEITFTNTTRDRLAEQLIDFSNSTDILFELNIEYETLDSDGHKCIIKEPLPLMFIKDNLFKPSIYSNVNKLTLGGFVQYMRTNKNFFKIIIEVDTDQIPTEIYNTGKIVCDVFSRINCPVFTV